MIGLPSWAIVAISAGAVGAALVVHARVRRFLPEDPPGTRKQQREPLVMVGCVLGQLVLAVAMLAGAPWFLSFALGVGLLAGMLDDFRKAQGGIGWRGKAGFLAAASVLVALGTAAQDSSPSSLECMARAGFAFAVINAVNFLDNTNGVLVAVAALPLVLGGDGVPGAELAAFAGWVFVGFLPFNWPKARCIAGDAGAYTLGVLLAWDALAAPSLLNALALTCVPLVDFVQVVSMRLALGFAPWIADRRHLPHIVVSIGLPQWLVAPLFAGLAWGGFVGLRALADWAR
jgi:UDP-N-acetylmuramyl pentapeptide phosphotransferase/UDP-N-acetylglucosamine-1-phosphate transferase